MGALQVRSVNMLRSGWSQQEEEAWSTHHGLSGRGNTANKDIAIWAGFLRLEKSDSFARLTMVQR